MSCFLVVCAPANRKDEAAGTFESGLESARELLGSEPHSEFRGEGLLAAAFRRHDGSGGEIALEPNGAGCLLGSGTWFHRGTAIDPAQLLARLREIGHTRLARELDGTFVVVDLDVRECRVTAFTDILGTGRCYVRELDNGTVALSASSLLLAALGPVYLDPVGAQEFLYTGNVYEHRTLYRDVKKLGPAGSIVVIGNDVKRPGRYWTVAELEPESISGREAVVALSEALQGAVRRIGRRFRHPICDLTGGYDSRAVVSQFLSADVPCSAAVTGQPLDPDVVTARMLADAVDLDLKVVSARPETTFDRLTETLRWTDGEREMLSYRRISDVHLQLLGGFDVSVNGVLGELARGYRYELVRPGFGARRPLDAHRAARRLFAPHRHEPSIVSASRRFDLVEHMTGMVKRVVAPLHDRPNYFQLDHAGNELVMGAWYGRIAASTDRIRPLTSPFAFRPVVETLMATHGKDKVRNLLVRRLLAAQQPRWAGIPHADGRPSAPLNVNNLRMLWPLAAHVCRRVTHKAGWGRSVSEGIASRADWRQQLWHDEAVAWLLDTNNMLSAELFDAQRLNEFLVRSRTKGFEMHDQWSRVLTLEYTLQRLEQCRRQSLRIKTA